MHKYVLAAALIVGCTLPAFAAKGFYIVRGPDKKCMVVDVAPVTTETKIGNRQGRLHLPRRGPGRFSRGLQADVVLPNPARALGRVR